MPPFNSYKFRRNGQGQEYAVVLIDSKRFGMLEVRIDRPDLERYLEERGTRIYATSDDRGVRPITRCRVEGRVREQDLHAWILRGETAASGARVHVRDGNLLNCQRSNLELRTLSEIGHRTERRKKGSGLPQGVTYQRRGQKPYMARIWLDGKHVFLGSFEKSEEAAEAYRKAKGSYLAGYPANRF